MTLADTRPIFVVGYMHSGTTLLFNLLARSSSVYSCVGETRFFEQLSSIRRTFPDLNDPKQAIDFAGFISRLIPGQVALATGARDMSGKLNGESSKCAAAVADALRGCDHGAGFRLVFDWLAQNAGKSRWVEKTPTHVFHVDEIVRTIPDARLVEIVRDPRDVLASKKTRRGTVWTSDRYRPDQRAFKHLEKAYDPVWDTLSWKAAIRAGQQARARYGDRYHTVRYEQLVRAPEDTVRRVCARLSIDYEPAMLDIRFRNAAEVGASAGGISGDSVGRWKRVLDSGEIALCQWLAGPEMAAHDYPREGQGTTATMRVAAHLMSSSYEFGMRLVRRWRMGGTPFLMNTLWGYARRAKRLF